MADKKPVSKELEEIKKESVPEGAPEFEASEKPIKRVEGGPGENVAEQKMVFEKELQKAIEDVDSSAGAAVQKPESVEDAMALLKEENKLKVLLEVAKKKGVIMAVDMAKKDGDPYLVDKLHDILAKEGYYKKFIK